MAKLTNRTAWKPKARKSTHRLPPPFGRTTRFVAEAERPDGSRFLISGNPHDTAEAARDEAKAWCDKFNALPSIEQ